MRKIETIKTSLLKFRLMFSSPPHKLLFEHIPKCGGTTIVNFIKTQYPKRKAFPLYTLGRSQEFKALPEHQRYQYDLIYGHGAHLVRKYAHPEILKVIIFRDPVERIISHYYYVLRTPKHYLHSAVKENNLSLLDYATSDLSDELRNDVTARLLDIPADEAERNQDAAVAKAYSTVYNEYDVIGLLDSIDVAMRELVEVAHLPIGFKNKKVNETTGRPKFDEIDPVVKDTIRAVNHLDVKLYELIAAKDPEDSSQQMLTI